MDENPYHIIDTQCKAPSKLEVPTGDRNLGRKPFVRPQTADLRFFKVTLNERP